MLKKSSFVVQMLSLLVIYSIGMIFCTLGAQTVVQVGSGNSYQLQYPTACHFGYTRTAAIYTNFELGFSGAVSNLAWYATASQGYTVPCKIYLKEVTAANLTTTNWAAQTSGATLVYTGSFSPITANTWVSKALPTPYFYHNSSNHLLVLVECNYGASGAGAARTAGIIQFTNSNANCEEWAANTNPPTGMGTVTPWRPLIQITLNLPMAVASLTCNQNISNTKPGVTNQQIISIPVETTGSELPLNVSQFSLNANGTTNIADISNAKLFYTGTSNVFAATTQFGTTVAAPSATNYTINGTQNLVTGFNYFWLTYDIAPTATISNVVDAECSYVTIDGVPYPATPAAPSGSRTIMGPLTGTKTIGPGGDYTTFTGAINDLNLLGTDVGGVTFNVTAGTTFAEDPPAITATGSVTNPIIFQSSGITHAILKPTGTAGTMDFGISLIGGDYFTFDGIDVIINSGSAVEYGYYLIGATTDGVNYNTVKNCSISLNGANTTSVGIYQCATGSLPANRNTNNHYYNLAISNAAVGIQLSSTSLAGNEDTGNEIGILPGGSTTISNISSSSNAIGIGLVNQQNCNVSNVTINGVNGTLVGNGIYAAGTTNNVHIFNNNVSAITGLSSANGIILNGGTFDVHNNIISNISSNYMYGTATGLYCINNSTSNLYSNTISNIAVTGTGSGPVAYGLEVGGTNSNVYNNMVYGISCPNSSASPSAGAYLLFGTSNFYNNTILLTGTTTITTCNSAALYHNPANGMADIRNNVLVNNSATGTLGKAVAFWQIYYTNLNIAATTNNNLYYAGTPDSQHLIYTNGNSNAQTLAAYKTFITPIDNAAVTENPPFISTSNLHVQTTVITSIEGSGLPITTPVALTNDIDGDLRSVTNPDLGADEGNFLTANPLPSIANLSSPANASTNQLNNVALSWSSGIVPPTSYRLYLGTDNPPTNMVANQNMGMITSYSNPTPYNYGITYYWQIVPVNGTGSALNCPIWSFTIELPAPPTALVATAGINLVNLVWLAPASGTPMGYNIYRDAVLITPTPIAALLFDDTNVALLSTYSYTVTAVYTNPTGESVASNASVAGPTENMPAPSGLTANVNVYEVSLNWAAPARGSRSMNGYKLYRDSLEIATFDNPNTTSYLDYAGPGNYAYTVVATYTMGNSPHCTAAVANVALCNPPATIHLSRAGSTLVVDWAAIPGAAAYNVYYATLPNAPELNWTVLGNSLTNSYVDTAPIDFQRYYKVRVVSP